MPFRSYESYEISESGIARYAPVGPGIYGIHNGRSHVSLAIWLGKYATIHPYYDGNGRTAGLLTTLILHLGVRSQGALCA
jgi:hypothetical protein